MSPVVNVAVGKCLWGVNGVVVNFVGVNVARGKLGGGGGGGGVTVVTVV